MCVSKWNTKESFAEESLMIRTCTSQIFWPNLINQNEYNNVQLNFYCCLNKVSDTGAATILIASVCLFSLNLK